LVTFMTMAYILFVQPTVLSTDFSGQATGLDAGAVLLATCVSSAIASLLMGWLARLPVALAPGMGQNFFFVSVIMTLAARGFAHPAQTALGIVLIAGFLFLLLSLTGIRAAILNALSPSLRSSVAVGIGALIAFIGLKNGGVIADAPSLVALDTARLLSAEAAVFWTGLLVTLGLTVRRIPGAVLAGLTAATAMAAINGTLEIPAVVGLPQIETHSAFAFDVSSALSVTCLPFIIVFLFMDVFDTMGTLVGVTQQAGLMQDGRIPRLKQAMIADSLGTVVGAVLGTSTVTSYIESAAGVQQGGRTGLTAITVAVLFLLALPFSPLITAVGSCLPITAPALVVVGAMMFSNVRQIDWDDETEAIPAFLIILGIPLFFSIADGMALGFIAWPLLKLMRGRPREASWLMYIMAAALVIYFLYFRMRV
ncbi:MAG: NCS2 family permease, partial [Planctomycetaceae bacterium]|nr:NCS2 family permease [Planctomycetaceae bacterium]